MRTKTNKRLTAQEHIEQARLLLEAAKNKIDETGHFDIARILDEALNELTYARRETIRKGRAGFYAGRG